MDIFSLNYTHPSCEQNCKRQLISHAVTTQTLRLTQSCLISLIPSTSRGLDMVCRRSEPQYLEFPIFLEIFAASPIWLQRQIGKPEFEFPADKFRDVSRIMKHGVEYNEVLHSTSLSLESNDCHGMTGMLEVNGWQVCPPYTLGWVYDPGHEVILHIFHQQCLGLARLPIFEPLCIARDVEKTEHGESLGGPDVLASAFNTSGLNPALRVDPPIPGLLYIVLDMEDGRDLLLEISISLETRAIDVGCHHLNVPIATEAPFLLKFGDVMDAVMT